MIARHLSAWTRCEESGTGSQHCQGQHRLRRAVLRKARLWRRSEVHADVSTHASLPKSRRSGGSPSKLELCETLDSRHAKRTTSPVLRRRHAGEDMQCKYDYDDIHASTTRSTLMQLVHALTAISVYRCHPFPSNILGHRSLSGLPHGL